MILLANLDATLGGMPTHLGERDRRMNPMTVLAALRLLHQICHYHFLHKELALVSSTVSSKRKGHYLFAVQPQDSSLTHAYLESVLIWMFQTQTS